MRRARLQLAMKPKLLVLELWGIGDLVIATPFLQAASQKYDVTLIAKPHALDLQKRFWPNIEVIPFNAPWTSFTGKYRLHRWPWKKLFVLRRNLARKRFDFGISARWDPRDHLILFSVRAKRRFGFPRLGSGMFLMNGLVLPERTEHRYEYWRVIGRALGIDLPPKDKLTFSPAKVGRYVLLHSGAGKPARVWRLEYFLELVNALRGLGYEVQVACDVPQRQWWLNSGETRVRTPSTVSELLNLVEESFAFIGNDSGPGHLAALCSVPTFTIFGPTVPEWFAPLNPAAEFIQGKPCPYYPCKDYCHFDEPHCLWKHTPKEILARIEDFLSRIRKASLPT
jgi:ADP-heptose:LPS heptosyltransferase